MFYVLNQILLIKYPLSIRRIDSSRKVMDVVENLSEFLRRVHTTALNADLEACPLITTVLLKFTECLPENTLNNKIKLYIYAELRKVPNVRTLDAVFPGIEVMVSDENTRRITKGAERF